MLLGEIRNSEESSKARALLSCLTWRKNAYLKTSPYLLFFLFFSIESNFYLYSYTYFFSPWSKNVSGRESHKPFPGKLGAWFCRAWLKSMDTPGGGAPCFGGFVKLMPLWLHFHRRELSPLFGF